MSKAILILDEMSKSCEECRLSYQEWKSENKRPIELKCCLCKEKQIWESADPEEKVPKWCPLKPSPERPDFVIGDCMKEIGGTE